MKRRTIAEQLKAAKNCILKYGWIKNDLGDRQRGFCMLGALGSARAGTKAEEMLSSVLKDMDGSGMFKGEVLIDDYNDSKYRRLPHVLKAFDRAIEKAKKNNS